MSNQLIDLEKGRGAISGFGVRNIGKFAAVGEMNAEMEREE
jgi:hypothetical protein